MTTAEAIEILKKKIVPCVKHSAWEEAVQMAISALEKQEGKKPIEDGYFNIPCACPMCGNGLAEDSLLKAVSYCPNCGQRIDWGDECGNGR